jgi:hypothetical protein
MTNKKREYVADDADHECNRRRTIIEPQGVRFPDRMLLPCECGRFEPVVLHEYRRVEVDAPDGERVLTPTRGEGGAG